MPTGKQTKKTYIYKIKTERAEKRWVVGKWKSKGRIPTFPPPRMPAAQGKDPFIKQGPNAMRRRPHATRQLWGDVSRPSGSLRPPKPTDRRHQDHCPENGLLSCHGPVDSAYGAVCFGVPSHRTLHLRQAASLSWHIGITITRTPQRYGLKGTFLLCRKGGHFYFALTFAQASLTWFVRNDRFNRFSRGRLRCLRRKYSLL